MTARRWLSRSWPVQIIGKMELNPGYMVTMREPEGLDVNRPYWAMRSEGGGTLSLNVTREEYDDLQVGEILTIRIAAESGKVGQ